jgi:hypothetical protein
MDQFALSDTSPYNNLRAPVSHRDLGKKITLKSHNTKNQPSSLVNVFVPAMGLTDPAVEDCPQLLFFTFHVFNFHMQYFCYIYK